MKKQLLPLLVLSSVLCVACNTAGNSINSNANNSNDSSSSDNSHESSESKSSTDSSSLFIPDNKNVTLLKKVPETKPNYSDLYADGFQAFLNDFNKFNTSFSDDYVKKYFNPEKNDTISPLSIYFAMAQAGSTTAGTTQKEIFDALNISYEDALTYSPTLYKLTNRVKYDHAGEKIVAIEDVNNSFWFEKSLKLKQSCVDTLVDSFFCEPYAADFLHNPSDVSKEMNNYVIDKTRGLIDPKLDFDNFVRMVIVNTLYMKDQWNEMGDDLEYEANEREFTNYDLSKTKKSFLVGNYSNGVTYESTDFTYFKASTANGFKINFMVPNEGKKIDEIFTEENILEMHNASTNPSDGKEHNTRCIFPEFTASAGDDLNLIEMFKERGVNQFFVDADFSNILEEQNETIICSDIKHLTKLIVDKTGVEGAAVTIITEKATSIGSDEKPIYHDFIVDKAFGFEVCDAWSNIPLFTGYVTKI